MRVKLQLVICNDEGQEETVTDVIALNKNQQRIEHLGLTLAEAKQLLRNWPTINSRFTYTQEQRGSSTWAGNRQRRFS